MSGLPGAAGLLALAAGGFRLRAVDPLHARWGREVWRARTFEETARYEVLVGGRRVGDVWRATGQSWRSERHVWLAAPASHPDHVATTVASADDLQSTRRQAALNVAGAAALAFEIDGSRYSPSPSCRAPGTATRPSATSSGTGTRTPPASWRDGALPTGGTGQAATTSGTVSPTGNAGRGPRSRTRSTGKPASKARSAARWGAPDRDPLAPEDGWRQALPRMRPTKSFARISLVRVHSLRSEAYAPMVP